MQCIWSGPLFPKRFPGCSRKTQGQVHSRIGHSHLNTQKPSHLHCSTNFLYLSSTQKPCHLHCSTSPHLQQHRCQARTRQARYAKFGTASIAPCKQGGIENAFNIVRVTPPNKKARKLLAWAWNDVGLGGAPPKHCTRRTIYSGASLTLIVWRPEGIAIVRTMCQVSGAASNAPYTLTHAGVIDARWNWCAEDYDV